MGGSSAARARGDEDASMEGLGDEIIGAPRISFQDGFGSRSRGQQDDRGRPKAAFSLIARQMSCPLTPAS